MCYVDYMSAKLGCDLPWRKGGGESRAWCQTEEEMEAFKKLSHEMYESDEHRYELVCGTTDHP